jgi:tRNA A37 methylthiotransferase MiaB
VHINLKRLFYIVDLSCKRREEDVSNIISFLLENNWSYAKKLKDADFVLLNTCAFNKSKVEFMKEKIVRIKNKAKKEAIFMVGGCLPKTDYNSLYNLFKGKTINPSDFSALNDLPGIETKIEDISKNEYRENLIPAYFNHKPADISIIKRGIYSLKNKGLFATIKSAITPHIGKGNNATKNKEFKIFIAKGCNRKCSYCAIHFAVGSLNSKPLSSVLNRINEGIDLGYKKIGLFGDSIGDYGLDINIDLGKLLDKISSIDKDFSIALYDLHPSSFLMYFNQIERLCKSGKIYLLYIPIQSANKRILKLMERYYDIDQVRSNVLKLKKYKKLYIINGIIIGFPSETEKEFEDTLTFLNETKNNMSLIHFYSDMPNTKSSNMEPKVDKISMGARYAKIKNSNIPHYKQCIEKELKTL